MSQPLLVRITIDIPDEHAPSFRTAVEHFSNSLGEKVEKNIHKYDTEDSWTRAVAAVGVLRAATNKAIPQGDSDYR